MQLGRLLDFVAEGGADDGAGEDDVASPCRLPMPKAAKVSDRKSSEGKGETLSRYEMIQRLAAADTTGDSEDVVVTHLLKDFSAQVFSCMFVTPCIHMCLHTCLHFLSTCRGCVHAGLLLSPHLFTHTCNTYVCIRVYMYRTLMFQYVQPLCMLELIHKLLHTLAGLASQVRMRGQVVDMSFDLDDAVRQSLTYSPEASLFFAEMSLDRYEAILKDKVRVAREKQEASSHAIHDAVSSQDVAMPDASSDDAAETAYSERKTHLRYLSGYEFHIKGLWCERFCGWREQARYFWLLARAALCQGEPWNALEPLARCKAVFSAAHPDAEALASAVIFLPSCQMNNWISVRGIDRCGRGPLQEVCDLCVLVCVFLFLGEGAGGREIIVCVCECVCVCVCVCLCVCVCVCV